MNYRKIFYWSIVVALAGFLFGFDTVVISGADKQLQTLWNSSNLYHGLVVMSSALWGTVVGAVFGSWPTNHWGRKKTLVAIGVLFLLSAVGTCMANDPVSFAVFRFLGGLGIGVSTIAAPAYVSEIAPAAKRGQLVALYQFNIVFGINAFLYYAPRIFELAGLEQSASFLSSMGIGLINLIFTIIGVGLIDKFGRKTLMFVGSIGYIISLGLVAIAFALEWKGMLVPLFFFVFIAAHAIGQGAVIWVFISEIFPNKLRAAGQSFGSSVHWVLAAMIPAFMPFTIEKIGAASVFAFFCIMMIGQLAWVYFKMPETKGKSLEDVSQSLKS